MNQRKKLALGVLVLGILGALSTAACGHHRSHNPEHAKKFVTHRVDHMLGKIDATEKQEAEVHKITDRMLAEFLSAHAGSADAKRLVLAEWKKDTPDAKKLHALADQRIAAYQKAVHASVDGMIEVHQVLDKKQRAELSQFVEKRMH